jgi:hypothetical protein
MCLPRNQLAAFFSRSSHRLGSVHFHHSFQLIHTNVLQLQLLESNVRLCEREKWFIHNDSNNATASHCGLRPMRAGVTNSCTALVQGVSWGNVNVLEGHSIGHCERKVHTNICLILKGYRDRVVWAYKYKSILNGNKQRDITYCWFYFHFNLLFRCQICYTEMTNLSQFKINIWESQRQTHCTSQLARRSPLVRLSWSSRFYMRVAASKTASEQFVSCINPSSVKFALHPTPQKNLT